MSAVQIECFYKTFLVVELVKIQFFLVKFQCGLATLFILHTCFSECFQFVFEQLLPRAGVSV